MKKIFYLASIAALALSSCAKDDTTGVELGAKNDGLKIVASQNFDTRSFLGRNEDGNLVPLWSAGDAFSAYGDAENSVKNVKFSLDPNDHGKQDGTFQSEGDNHLLLDGDNVVFIYPHNRFYTMTPTWEADGTLNEKTVNELQITAEQQYQEGTFTSTSAPQIGFLDLETIDANDLGNGRHEAFEVQMTSLTDYVAVNLVGTADIHAVKLVLFDGFPTGATQKYVINGKMNLNEYEIAGQTNYYLAPATAKQAYDKTTNTENIIKVGRQDNIVCHDTRTYVFTVPGGILGMGKGVYARVYVIDENGNSTVVATQNGPSINGGDGWNRNWKDGKVNTEAINEGGLDMSNGVFWMNEKLADGSRGAYLYNPDNYFIIRNELDWLIYFNEYANPDYAPADAAAGTPAAAKWYPGTAYGRNAYVCAHEDGMGEIFEDGQVNFDFENLAAIAAKLKDVDRPYLVQEKNYSENKDIYTAYIDDYHNYGLPCIDNYIGVPVNGENAGDTVYNATFKGHEAVLNNVGEIQSTNGIFGKLGTEANISKISFGDVVSAGVVLSSNTDAGTIAEIGVSNAQANAVIGTTTKVADYEALVLEEVSGLNYIINDMTLDEDLAVANWTTVYNVAENVFASLDTDKDEHNTVSTPSVIADYTADYAKLAGEVAIYRAVENKTAVSVILDDRSMWTGSWAKTAVNNVLANAEQLAYNNNFAATLAIDVDANYENIEISWPNEVKYASLDGGNNTIYGLTMKTYNTGRGLESKDGFYLDLKTLYIYTSTNVYNNEYNFGSDVLAPFNLEAVKNLNIEGLSMTIETNNTTDAPQRVPKYVAGLSKVVKNVDNVVINGMSVVATEMSQSNNDDAWHNNVVPRIGWFAAATTSNHAARIENSSANVVNCTGILGISALIAEAEVSDHDVYFNNCVVNSVVTGMNAITDFAIFDPAVKNYRLNGTLVGLVINNDVISHGIKAENSGDPKFLYHFGDAATADSAIAVYNGNNHTYSIYNNANGVVAK